MFSRQGQIKKKINCLKLEFELLENFSLKALVLPKNIVPLKSYFKLVNLKAKCYIFVYNGSTLQSILGKKLMEHLVHHALDLYRFKIIPIIVLWAKDELE